MVMERGLEKEEAAELAARRADLRMRCLGINIISKLLRSVQDSKRL